MSCFGLLTACLKMEDTRTRVFYLSLSALLILYALKLLLLRSKTRHKNPPPPAPPSLPIIGHLHLIKPPVHRLLHELSRKYGPIISLRFGSRPVVAISSAALAEECFTKNDILLANRPKLLFGKYIGYNYTTMVHSSYGDHWRNLRRIGAVEIFSASRLNAFIGVRKDEVRRLLLRLSTNSRGGFARVELKSMFTDLTFNNIMRMVAGKRYYGEDVKDRAEAEEFKAVMKEVVKNGGASNPADFLPILKWLGFEKTLKGLSKRLDTFMQRLVDEQRRNRGANTMIDHLLSLQDSDPHYYSDTIIKGILMVLLFAGTDTTSVTLEWAMSNLLNNPDVLKKAREEIDAKVGQENLIDETDATDLPYLQHIISETLRLHPAAPLLVPHTPSTDCTIGGYEVRRDTIVLVNAWGIHRDPNSWENPTGFEPERFEEENAGLKMLSFGLGRRACPGATLAQRMLGLVLGSLIQCFEWERLGEEAIDMSEARGGVVHKAVPLEAMCKARPIVHEVLCATASD